MVRAAGLAEVYTIVEEMDDACQGWDTLYFGIACSSVALRFEKGWPRTSMLPLLLRPLLLAAGCCSLSGASA